jgi:anaerobic selenocysteine-containing dehydrogenase
MATKDTGQGARGVTRRDFLKTAAAASAVVGCGLDFAFDAEKALAYEGDSNYQITPTTCPYCSASCGQRVVVDKRSSSPTYNKVIDIYGDFESPLNSGGLCAKGAGALELVTNTRRIGAWEGPHPVNNTFSAVSGAWNMTNDPVPSGWPGTDYSAGTFSYTDDGVAYFRKGDNAWQRVPLQIAMQQAAAQLTTARGSITSGTYNTKNVAFFGSSHMNNESNYMYRKMIANFGTSNVEHQARI